MSRRIDLIDGARGIRITWKGFLFYILIKFHISNIDSARLGFGRIGRLKRKLRRWVLKKWVQFRDLSIRPFGYRLLSVDKGDYKYTVYLNDSEEPENGIFEAKVLNEPNVWGWGWVHRYEMDDGHIVASNGEARTYYKYGRVMWKATQ